jgi:hypothetical protein
MCIWIFPNHFDPPAFSNQLCKPSQISLGNGLVSLNQSEFVDDFPCFLSFSVSHNGSQLTHQGSCGLFACLPSHSKVKKKNIWTQDQLLWSTQWIPSNLKLAQANVRYIQELESCHPVYHLYDKGRENLLPPKLHSPHAKLVNLQNMQKSLDTLVGHGTYWCGSWLGWRSIGGACLSCNDQRTGGVSHLNCKLYHDKGKSTWIFWTEKYFYVFVKKCAPLYDKPVWIYMKTAYLLSTNIDQFQP